MQQEKSNRKKGNSVDGDKEPGWKVKILRLKKSNQKKGYRK